MYDYNQVYQASLEYFKGDELAASVFAGKYALQDAEGNYLEKTPKDMHKRIAKELARIEAKYPNAMSEEEIFSLGRGVSVRRPLVLVLLHWRRRLFLSHLLRAQFRPGLKS